MCLKPANNFASASAPEILAEGGFPRTSPPGLQAPRCTVRTPGAEPEVPKRRVPSAHLLGSTLSGCWTNPAACQSVYLSPESPDGAQLRSFPRIIFISILETVRKKSRGVRATRARARSLLSRWHRIIHEPFPQPVPTWSSPSHRKKSQLRAESGWMRRSAAAKVPPAKSQGTSKRRGAGEVKSRGRRKPKLKVCALASS